MLVRCVPFAFITQMSAGADPSGWSAVNGMLANVIFLPSGEKPGLNSSSDGVFVNWVRFAPLASMTQISWASGHASHDDTANRIRVPSGDQSGLKAIIE